MTSTSTVKPLGELLLGRGLIAQEQLDRALVEQRHGEHEKLLGEILVELNDCTEEQVAEALAESYGLPFARVTPRLVDPKIVPLLPREFLDRHVVLPLFLVDDDLTVAMSEPTDVFVIEEIERLTTKSVFPVAATAGDIRATLAAYLSEESGFALDALIEQTPADTMELTRPSGEPAELVLPAHAPAAKLVRYCLANAVKRGASAAHFEPDGDVLRVRLRIDGALSELLRTPLRSSTGITDQIKAAAGMRPQTTGPQEGDFAAVINGKQRQLHVSSVPVRGGDRLLVRISESRKPSFGFEQLGFGYDTLKLWRRLIGRTSGLVLVAGPSSSGHLTTLYSSLEFRSAVDLSACTVENPIRYAIPGVSQFEIDSDAGFNTAKALESVLRQDPDVIMTTDLPDSASAQLAANAAMNGKLVMAGISAIEASAALHRLLILGVEPYIAASTVSGVLAQRLVRRLCPSCRDAEEPTPGQRRMMEQFGHDGGVIYRAKGCERCHGTGYLGRVGIFELLVPDDAIIDQLSRGATLQELRDLTKRSGMKPLRADGFDKVKAGITTIEEVTRFAT